LTNFFIPTGLPFEIIEDVLVTIVLIIFSVYLLIVSTKNDPDLAGVRKLIRAIGFWLFIGSFTLGISFTIRVDHQFLVEKAAEIVLSFSLLLCERIYWRAKATEKVKAALQVANAGLHHTIINDLDLY
jgi:hypothetical protein